MHTPYTLAGLLTELAAGARPKYLLFWGHTPKRAGVVDQSCLSQWFPAVFNIDGIRYPTAEHYMMAQKATLFGDLTAREKILLARTPAEAKQLGRTVAGFDHAAWEAQRSAIVEAGNFAKFGQNPELRQFLLGTGKRTLVEASPVDRIWGIGLAADDPHAEHPAKWRGLNLLGFALMAVRDQLGEAA
ncbi:NADAR family protein [Parachitinimonas caeni]|uniref:NADAR family protein n=1 Tax=Parachitinimonas caeni TaxID=3031301 RepID=A0ABT7DXY9_9NEIS|nr:NADAR family protein [Parachitinimonas caeni]MDK2124941.1 NADAR family protein [Parachitinimonas caeni]